MNPIELAHTVINALEERKGENILLLDLNNLTTLADFFVLCTGTSDRMLDALADAAVDAARKKHRKKGRLEGIPSAGWLVIDFGDVVVHLFSPDQRDYYRLEDLWAEGKVLLHLQ